MWNKKFLLVAAAGIISFLPAAGSASASENLIFNPSVETESSAGLPEGWLKGGWGNNDRQLSYPVPGNHGSDALRVDITSYAGGDAKWYFQDVPVTPGASYSFSDDFISNATSYLVVRFKKEDGTFQYTYIGTFAPSASWKTARKNFTVPSGTVSLTVFHKIQSVGYLVTDNFSLIKISSSEPGNLIANHSLEIPSADTNLPKSWFKGGYGRNNRLLAYPVAGVDGLSAAKIEITSYTDGDAKWYFQDVPAAPGDTFEFSDYYKSDTTSYLTIRWKMSDGSYRYDWLDEKGFSSFWSQFKTTFTAPSGAVSLTVFHALRGVGTLTVDNYSLKKLGSNRFSEGMVTLTFDDGFLSAYENALPILQKVGVKSGHYIVKNYLNGFSGYMNKDQVLEINSLGHEIGSHTLSHAHLTQLSDADAWKEINQSRLDLLAMGMKPVDFFIYPYGEHDARIRQMVRDAGYLGARGVGDGLNYRDTDKYNLKTFPLEEGITFSDVKGWIDQAIAERSWLVLEIHRVEYNGGKYSVTPELFQDTVDYIKQTGIKVVKSLEGIALMN